MITLYQRTLKAVQEVIEVAGAADEMFESWGLTDEEGMGRELLHRYEADALASLSERVDQLLDQEKAGSR